MKRQMVRLILAAILVLVTVVAGILWSGSYSSNPDADAGFEIFGAKLTKDESYYWLELHMKKAGDEDHDLKKPVRLITGVKGEVEHEPADTVFAGNRDENYAEIWFKFWLEEKDLEKVISLRMNDGLLFVKVNEGLPVLDNGEESVFKSEDWSKSWLGF